VTGRQGRISSNKIKTRGKINYPEGKRGGKTFEKGGTREADFLDQRARKKSTSSVGGGYFAQ